MTTQKFIIEVTDESEEIDAEDLSLIIEETLERHMPTGYTYLLTEAEDTDA